MVRCEALGLCGIAEHGKLLVEEKAAFNEVSFVRSSNLVGGSERGVKNSPSGFVESSLAISTDCILWLMASAGGKEPKLCCMGVEKAEWFQVLCV